MDNFEQRLSYTIRELHTAHTVLEERIGMKLQGIEVQWALTEALGILSGERDTLDNLIAQCPDARTIVQLLSDFPFLKFHPVELGRIELEEDVIPPDVPRKLEEQQVKRDGKIWTIHKNDADPFPSNPHAHNYDENLKLDLSDGTLYRYKQPQGRIKWKDLLMLRSLINGIDLPPLAQK